MRPPMTTVQCVRGQIFGNIGILIVKCYNDAQLGELKNPNSA